MPSEDVLINLISRYVSYHPGSAAQALESLNAESAASALMQLPLPTAKEIFHQVSETYAAQMASHFPPERLGELSAGMDPEQAGRLFQQLPSELRKPFLKAFTVQQRRRIREFLSYPEASAGKVMMKRFTALAPTTSVKEAIEKLRRGYRQIHRTNYIYVVDKSMTLLGMVSVWDLLMADEAAPLESIMGEVFSVNCFMDLDQLANEFSNRRYFALPVVDNENKLLGVVRAEQVIEDIQEQASEDLQIMFGAGGEEKPFSSIWFSLKQRILWLHANLATAFMAAAVVGFFEGIIAKITILAVYLPVVAGQGGNAGAQSLAVVMRGLVMREIPRQRFTQLILKEALIGTINGLVIGMVTGLIAWTWHGNPYLGVVVGLGMIVNLLVAGLAGAGIPLLVKALGGDPAQSANIILTTITDTVGFFAFLGFAAVFQQYLTGI